MITIKDIQERPVKACCQIPYKGYIISISTLMGKCASIAVFKSDNKYEEYGFETFQDAIEKIDDMTCSIRTKMRMLKAVLS